MSDSIYILASGSLQKVKAHSDDAYLDKIRIGESFGPN